MHNFNIYFLAWNLILVSSFFYSYVPVPTLTLSRARHNGFVFWPAMPGQILLDGGEDMDDLKWRTQNQFLARSSFHTSILECCRVRLFATFSNRYWQPVCHSTRLWYYQQARNHWKEQTHGWNNYESINLIQFYTDTCLNYVQKKSIFKIIGKLVYYCD